MTKTLPTSTGNAQDHCPFDVERYIDRQISAPRVESICNNNAGAGRDFTVDTRKLVDVED